MEIKATFQEMTSPFYVLRKSMSVYVCVWLYMHVHVHEFSPPLISV